MNSAYRNKGAVQETHHFTVHNPTRRNIARKVASQQTGEQNPLETFFAKLLTLEFRIFVHFAFNEEHDKKKEEQCRFPIFPTVTKTRRSVSRSVRDLPADSATARINIGWRFSPS